MKELAALLFLMSSPALAQEIGVGEVAAVCGYDTLPAEIEENARVGCLSYIRGFLGYHSVLGVFLPEARVFCLPPGGETLNTIRMLFVARAKRHDIDKKDPAAIVMMDAISEAFPCPSK